MPVSREELDAVSRYLDDGSKTLDGDQPDWKREGRGDFQAVWLIREQDGRIRSQLRFRLHPDMRDFPSVSLIFRDKNVSRFDKVRQSNCEPNPLSARALDLPALVCGPHVHRWSDNIKHVELSGIWDLPVRRPVIDTITTLEQMFLWFCNEISLTLSKEHRRFVDPPKDLLS